MNEEEIKKAFFNDRVVFLEGDFEEKNCQELTKKLLYLSAKDKHKDITLYIDSYGGDAYSFVQLYNVIQTLKCNVHTIAMGKAMSAGALLLILGTKGYRFAYKNSYIMLHELSSSVRFSKLHEQEIGLEHSQVLQKDMNDMVVKNTKIKRKDVKNWMKENKYMTAEEALKLGIIDKIIGVE